MRVLLAVALGIAIAMTIFLYFGCRCRIETFEAQPPPTQTLSKQEQELFEDLKAQRLTDDQVSKLIDAGILNSNVFEKFLNLLGNQETANAKTATAAPEGFALER